MKSVLLAIGAITTLSLLASQPAGAASVSVAGTSDPFLAGMPAGSTCCSGDLAPAESPAYAGSVTPGGMVSFTGVTGGVSYAGGTPTDGPNGDAGYLIDTPAYEGGLTTINNIAGYYNAPVDALVGVFLGSGLPTGNPAPALLDFSAGYDTTPALQQIFFIGDGDSGLVFTAPAGATRLYLAVVDGFGWYNNTGAINLTVNGVGGVPEPATWAMMLAGVGGVGAMIRRRRGLAAA